MSPEVVRKPFSMVSFPETEAEFFNPPVPSESPLSLLMIIPTYNESENIAGLIDRIIALGPEFGVLVVDDHSPDGTAELVRRYQATHAAHVYLLLRRTNRGRGQAGIDGYLQALCMKVPVIGEMDADGSHAPEDLARMVHSLREEVSGVIGSRLVPGGREEGRSLARVLLTRAANLYIRLILGLPYRDATSGYRIFRREVLETIRWNDLVSRGPSILQEMLVIIHRGGWSLIESPIVFRERVLGASTLNHRILLNSLRIILEFRKRYGRNRRTRSVA